MAFKKQIKIAILVLALTSAPFFANAAGLVPCGGTGTGPDAHPCTVLDAFYGVARVTNWLIMMAGVYAVYQFVNAGFWLVASSGDEEKITKYRKSLQSTIVGFFVVVAAYMFMNTAVNILLMSKCKINFASPLTYITLTNPSNYTCEPNSYNVGAGIVPAK